MCQLFLCCERVVRSWSRIPNVQTFNPVSKNVPEVFEFECRGQRASADISCVLPCLERLKRSSLRWLPLECHMAFWTLIVILIQSKRTPTHSGSRRPPSGKFRWCVFETKTFESDTKSIIGLQPLKQAVEKHKSDLLAVSEQNVDLKRFSPAEIAGVARRLLVMELKRSVFNELHEYLEQSFCAEIAIVVKRLKTVKEITGNMRNSQTAERVEESENEKCVNVNSTS